MNIEKIRKMSENDLQKEILESCKKILNLRMLATSGEHVNAHLYKTTRKRIAKIKTILTQKRAQND